LIVSPKMVASPATLATYDFAAAKLEKSIGGLRVCEASAARLDAALRSMRTAHGATIAKQAKTILRGALQLAVMASVLNANPMRDVRRCKASAETLSPIPRATDVSHQPT
jgi:hypothetical protein